MTNHRNRLFVLLAVLGVTIIAAVGYAVAPATRVTAVQISSQASTTIPSTKGGLWWNGSTSGPQWRKADGTDITLAAGGGSGYSEVDDEGSALTARTKLNFIGAGVTCVDNSGATRTDCTVTSGGGAGTVTSIATNNGLTGGTITTTGTIGIDSTAVLSARGFTSSSSAPTCVAGNGPGTGGSLGCTVAGNNEAGIVTVTYGSSTGAGAGTEFVVTLANSVACATKAVAHVYPGDSATGTRFNMFNISNFTWMTGTTTTWTLNANAPIGVSNAVYTYPYHMRCY